MSQPNSQPQNQPQQQDPAPPPATQPGPQVPSGLLNQPPEQQPSPPPQDPVEGRLAALQQQFTSELDRRINQVVSTLRRELVVSPQPPAQPVPPPVPAPAPASPVQVVPPGPSALDLQEARSVYREFVADQVTFLGPTEREFAQSLASAEIAARLARGERPETAGQEAAGRVAGTVKGLREMYEKATVEALRKRGQLKEQPGGAPGAQPVPGGPPVPGAQRGWSDGQARARQMYQDRLPQPQPAQQ